MKCVVLIRSDKTLHAHSIVEAVHPSGISPNVSGIKLTNLRNRNAHLDRQFYLLAVKLGSDYLDSRAILG